MTVNPYDIKSALLAKHAQHVVLIHLPIALFPAAVAFDYLAQWMKNRTLAAAAYFNLLLAAVSTVPSRCDRFCCVAMGARGATAQRDSVDAPRSGLRIECIDLICVVDPLARAAPSREAPTKLPLADRSACRIARGIDGASRRVSQRCQWTRLDDGLPTVLEGDPRNETSQQYPPVVDARGPVGESRAHLKRLPAPRRMPGAFHRDVAGTGA